MGYATGQLSDGLEFPQLLNLLFHQFALPALVGLAQRALDRGDQPLQVGLYQVILGAILQGGHSGFLTHRARNKNERQIGSLCS